MKSEKHKKFSSPVDLKKDQVRTEDLIPRIEERIPESQGDLADRATSEIDNEIARLVNRVCQASRRDSQLRRQEQLHS